MVLNSDDGDEKWGWWLVMMISDEADYGDDD